MVVILRARVLPSSVLRQHKLTLKTIPFYAPKQTICKFCSTTSQRPQQPFQPRTFRAVASAIASGPNSAASSLLSRRAFTASSTPRINQPSDNKMSSDQDYAAFLEKANEDPSKGTAQSSSAASNKPGQFRTTQQGVTVPAPISKALDKGDAFYVSDADEPFEAVALEWDEAGKGLPDEGAYTFSLHVISSLSFVYFSTTANEQCTNRGIRRLDSALGSQECRGADPGPC